MNQNTKKIPEKRKPGRSIGDASIVQHIHLLYVRAKRKWKQDLSCHNKHAEFAKEAQSHSMLSKIYAEALQVSTIILFFIYCNERLSKCIYTYVVSSAEFKPLDRGSIA